MSWSKGGGWFEGAACEALLTAHDDEALAAAVIAVAKDLESAETREGIEELCFTLRETGGMVRLGGLLAHADPIVHQTSLMLLATLTTPEVDSQAALTQAAPRGCQCGAGPGRAPLLARGAHGRIRVRSGAEHV